MQSKKLISLQISLGSYASFVDKLIALATTRQSDYICVANVHMLVEAYHSPAFADIVNQATLVTPDGKPLTWALKILYGIHQERVAGMDLLPDLLAAAETKKIPVGFYGGTEALLQKTDEQLKIKFPNLSIAKMYSPPFRPLNPDEENSVIQMLNDSGAAIIFVALGCPKQEKWMASMYGKINAVMIGIGGALPVLAGLQKRAPRWMQHVGLEWLYRLGQEPGRLLKRYASTNSLFIYLVMKEKFRSKDISSAQ
jgi:N-acetylglucosaminyldiphosphoundecaprenol N-acetyl-beta-D-mannosaminyltransferase